MCIALLSGRRDCLASSHCTEAWDIALDERSLLQCVLCPGVLSGVMLCHDVNLSSVLGNRIGIRDYIGQKALGLGSYHQSECDRLL